MVCESHAKLRGTQQVPALPIDPACPIELHTRGNRQGRRDDEIVNGSAHSLDNTPH